MKKFAEKLEKGVLRYFLPEVPALEVSFIGREIQDILPSCLLTGSAHGGQVVPVDSIYRLPEDAKARPDGFVTNLPGMKLAVKVADCATVLAVHPKTKAIGLAHAGWRGVCADVAGNLVRAMQSNFSLPAGELLILITPYADGKKYYVGVKDVPGWINVYLEFQKVFPQETLKNFFTPHESDARKAYLDIGPALQYQLGRAGIPDANLTVSEYRTISSDLFWSSRLQFPPEIFAAGTPRPPLRHNTMCAYMK